jgi:hypothetical protein
VEKNYFEKTRNANQRQRERLKDGFVGTVGYNIVRRRRGRVLETQRRL